MDLTEKQQELLEIAKQHRKYFATRTIWDEYAKKHDLPRMSSYIYRFGSVQKVKDLLEINPNYSQTEAFIELKKEEIRNILKEHGSHIENRTQWDEYAKEHKLPTYKTLVNYFSWEEILKLSGRPKKRKFTKEDLIPIARAHLDHFRSVGKWNDYAQEHDLPSAMTFIRTFGSWKLARNAVLSFNR
ncbi:hypothetical protein [Priestia koreensis]|uniref:hypothetical protein n=1 Tax=Priestia koreensis TaxID=284581 RepID=UPI001F57C459|nr:hypothetical protein [Priestia koreensis]MCM3005710.1 hypothetical protein [Priestia koreensis]UNL87590.1 hypothetical protein IE339_24125 [Priestia koreensis]